MRLKPYPERDGKRVWLSAEEIDNLISETETTRQRIALKLGGRCGLRRNEIIQITPADLVTSEKNNHHLRVWESVAKKGHYREPPAPDVLATEIQTLAEVDGLTKDEPLIGKTAKTVYRWVRKSAEQRQEETGDEGWSYLDVHDLRRSWATYVLGEGVLPSVVMSWGGWQDWDVFREHYLGEFSPEMIDRERQKVEFLADGTSTDRSNSHITLFSSPQHTDERGRRISR